MSFRLASMCVLVAACLPEQGSSIGKSFKPAELTHHAVVEDFGNLARRMGFIQEHARRDIEAMLAFDDKNEWGPQLRAASEYVNVAVDCALVFEREVEKQAPSGATLLETQTHLSYLYSTHYWGYYLSTGLHTANMMATLASPSIGKEEWKSIAGAASRSAQSIEADPILPQEQAYTWGAHRRRVFQRLKSTIGSSFYKVPAIAWYQVRGLSPEYGGPPQGCATGVPQVYDGAKLKAYVGSLRKARKTPSYINYLGSDELSNRGGSYFVEPWQQRLDGENVKLPQVEWGTADQREGRLSEVTQDLYDDNTDLDRLFCVNGGAKAPSCRLTNVKSVCAWSRDTTLPGVWESALWVYDGDREDGTPIYVQQPRPMREMRIGFFHRRKLERGTRGDSVPVSWRYIDNEHLTAMLTGSEKKHTWESEFSEYIGSQSFEPDRDFDASSNIVKLGRTKVTNYRAHYSGPK